MLDWAIPVLSIITGAVITIRLSFGWSRKRPGKSAPACPGCSVDSCAAMGGGDDDMEAIRLKLVERAEYLTNRVGNK